MAGLDSKRINRKVKEETFHCTGVVSRQDHSCHGLTPVYNKQMMYHKTIHFTPM